MRSSLFLIFAFYAFIHLVSLHNHVSAIPISWTNIENDTALPCIVSRKEWGAREPISRVPLDVSPTPYVVVHHGGIAKYCQDRKECVDIVRSYQNFHMDDRGWYDIGYSFVIGEDGSAYEGRGWDYVGAHAPGYNTQSMGICVMGDFSNFLPNDTALKTLDDLIKYGVSIGKISKNYKVIGHRQVRDTVCPGEEFYKYVKTHPRWTDKPIPRFPATITTEASVVVNENIVETSGES